MAFQVKEHIIPCQFVREFPRATADGQSTGLSLAVKQYTPSQPADPSFQKVTIVGSHGNGCPKELYEALWEDLHNNLLKEKIAIANIWIADVIHQGTSGVLNETKLGNEPSIFDHSRDIIYMINQFQNQMTLPIIGIGHSMGGTQLLQASLMHPRLFQTLILVEPVLYDAPPAHVKYGPAYLAASRRDRWPSRESVTAHTTRSKAYRSWDARCVQLWLQHAIREVEVEGETTTTAAAAGNNPAPGSPKKQQEEGGKEVTLKTSKHQETFTYVRPNYLEPFPTPSTAGEGEQPHSGQHIDKILLAHANDPFLQPEPMLVFYNLPFLKPSALFVYGALSNFLKDNGLPASVVAQTGASVLGSGGTAKGRVRSVEIEKAGHMAPLEQPRPLAETIAPWVAEEVVAWREEMREAELLWKGKEGHQKRQLDGEFLSHLGIEQGSSSSPREGKL